MPSGLVLVIEDDEWVSGLLASAIHGAGYDVAVCATARAGLETAASMQPDCIICDVDLPDQDGYWVARNVRTQPSRVSVTPFLFLSGFDDQDSRLEGFHVGADVYMTKPFRVDEVVAQVGALVTMASRLRQRRDSLLSAPESVQAGSAIEGDLSQMSIATVLTVLEMERRSGTFEVTSKKRRAALDIAQGLVVDGTVGGTKVSALTAMRTMLGWQVGRFSFTPTAPKPIPEQQKSIGAFLIEAVRLDDEEARLELDLPPSRRRHTDASKLAPPVLGGPASRHEDLAPGSSNLPLANERSSSKPAGGASSRSDIPLSNSDLELASIEPDPPSMRAPSMIGASRGPIAPPERTGLKLPPVPPPQRPPAIPPPKPTKRQSMRPPMGDIKIPPPPNSPSKIPGPPRVPRPDPHKK